MTDKISIASKIYVRMPITEQTGLDPTSDPLQMGLTASELVPPAMWTTGLWVPIGGRPWGELLVGPGSTYGPVAAGRYWLAARVTDNPEIPVLFSTNQLVFA